MHSVQPRVKSNFVFVVLLENVKCARVIYIVLTETNTKCEKAIDSVKTNLAPQAYDKKDDYSLSEKTEICTNNNTIQHSAYII